MTLALISALIIGISLGLLGSGGSILTVPVLVFILNRPEKLAIAESLAIVGNIALIGAFQYALKAHIHWRSVIFFGIPGMLGAYAGAYGSFYISGRIQLIIFAIVMLIIAALMVFGPKPAEKLSSSSYPIWLSILEGFFVGCLTGFIGVGGGFLIVPSLVLLSHLSMFLAIGTSLVIIAMNSFIGFTEQWINLNSLDMHVSWEIIGGISAAGIIGCFVGGLLAKRLSQIRLRQVFGLTILVMGSYILYSNFF